MDKLQAVYHRGEIKKFALVLIVAGVVAIALGFLSYYVISKNLYTFVIFMLLGVGTFATGILFVFKMHGSNIAFSVENDSFFLKGLQFKKEQVLRIDGVLNLGRDSSTEFLEEVATGAPIERFFGDVYIGIKGKQYKFSYISDIMNCFAYFSKIGVESSLIIWAGTSNRKYSYFDKE